jgi:peptidoglycan DL-endopeptidase CwlO
MGTGPLGRRIAVAVAVIAALMLALAVPSPAAANPGDEGGSPLLSEVLDTTGRAYLEAQAVLNESLKRQAALEEKAAGVEAELARRAPEVAAITRQAYRTGGAAGASILLQSTSSDQFYERAAALNTLAIRNDHKLRELNQLRRELKAARTSIAAEVAVQEKQAAEMAKRKREAEQALALAGGEATGGFVSATSPIAAPAPRGAGGSWPPESCSLDDPTTSGCITPRTRHALDEAKKAGFTRYVACFRPGDRFEHPKGRACDFAAAQNNFGGVATGGDRLYGNNLAAFFVRNADRLGVLYVIWFRQIWTPAVGWHRYGSAGGDPASDHTNHVHLSEI